MRIARLPDKPWSLQVFSNPDDDFPQPTPDFNGTFTLDIDPQGMIAGKHTCHRATTLGQAGGFDITGSATDTAVILDEPFLERRYTGTVVSIPNAGSTIVIMGDYGPMPPDTPALQKTQYKVAERPKKALDGQDQGTWVATKP
jgi:hypothetical protein